MLKFVRTPIAAVMFVCLLSSLILRVQATDPPVKSIKQLMASGFVRPDTAGRKALKGTASREELSELLKISQNLAGQTPPKGDKTEWSKRTKELISALQDGVDQKEGAVERIKKAVRCVDCHRTHRAAQ